MRSCPVFREVDLHHLSSNLESVTDLEREELGS